MLKRWSPPHLNSSPVQLMKCAELKSGTRMRGMKVRGPLRSAKVGTCWIQSPREEKVAGASGRSSEYVC